MLDDLIEKPIPLTGPAKIKREAIEGLRGCHIVQHGGGFRMHGNTFSVTLDALDALWLIDKLGLTAHKSDMMRRVVVWSE